MSGDAVTALFAALGEEPDETLFEYLNSILEDSEATESLELAELHDILSGFSPCFCSLPSSQQHALLDQFVKQAKQHNSTMQHGQVRRSSTQQPPQQQLNSEQPVAQHQQGSTHTGQADVQQAEECQPQAGPLLELYPGSSPAYLNHVLHDICQDRLEDAAHWLMDQDDLERSEASWYARQEQLQRDAEQAARQEKANRKQLLDKYHLQAVPTSAHTHLRTRCVQAPKSKNQVRYREGVAVTGKGEKYIVEKVGSEWDGGSTGKVVTKGKRGKGFV